MPDLLFSKAEYDRRLTSVRSLLDAAEIDCAILMSPEVQYWLCGYDTFLGSQIPQALIVARDSVELTLVLWDADVAIGHATSFVEDIRTYRFGVDEPHMVFADIVAERVPSIRRIGTEKASHALTYDFGCKLRDSLAPATLVDVTEALARLRAIKSPAELDLMRRAGAHARAGLDAAVRHARPGITEIGLAGEIEYAMRRSGSDYVSIPTEMTTGPRSVMGHGTPTGRVLGPGDLVHIEIGGVERRYNAVGIRTFVVPGAPVSKAARDLYRVALECLRAGLHQLRSGIPAAEVEAPALEILRREGMGDGFKMRFGYGVGIGYPPSWLEPLKITRTSTDTLSSGTTFVLHACLLDEVESIGVLVGATYAMTDDGYEMISGAGDVDLR